MSNSLLQQKKSSVYNSKPLFDLFSKDESKDEKEIAKDKLSKTYHATWNRHSSTSSVSSSYSEDTEEERKPRRIPPSEETTELTTLITDKFAQIEGMLNTLLSLSKVNNTCFESVYIPYVGSKWNIDPKNKTCIYPPYLYSVISIPKINQKVITLFESEIEYQTNTIESAIFESASGVLGTVLGDFLATKNGTYIFQMKEWVTNGSSFHPTSEHFPICVHIRILLKNRKNDTEKKTLLFELNSLEQ
jgi:hypothetical protein